MAELPLFDTHYWRPLAAYGFTHDFWRFNSETIINTWCVLAVILAFVVGTRVALRNKNSVVGYVVVSFVRAFKDLVEQSLGFFNFNHFCFITSLFTFIVLCNLISLIPFLEEPTKDLSTTLALGLCSFIYVQGNSIKTNGILGYLKEFMEPFFFMLPLHVVGLLATIVSISFRLFGNIFGGFIISKLYLVAIGGKPLFEIVGIVSGFNILITLFFIIFEGVIQAFVFSMLSLTYLSLAIGHKDHHE
jgi:F-type H+-transporting ATPase subunit a